MNRDAIEGLLKRIGAATGPDRAIDEDLFTLVNGRPRSISALEQYDPSEPLLACTASIDAAIALVEQALPGSRVGLYPYFFVDPIDVIWNAIICTPHMQQWNPVSNNWIERIEARHADRCRSILIAFLRALLEKDSK